MKLRKYQDECLAAIMSEVRDGKKKILAVLPTGAGKTIIQTRLTDALLEHFKEDFSACVIHLCHLKDISHKNKVYYDSHGTNTAMTMSGWGPDWKPSWTEKVVFTTMNTMRTERRIEAWHGMQMKRIPRVFVIDESHLYGCPSYDKVMEGFPGAILIGFTATPFRKNHLAASLFDSVAFATDLETLIAEDYLTPPTMYELTHETDDDEGRITAAYQIWMEKEKARGLPGILVCPTIEKAQTARLVLTSSGVRCGYFDGETSQEIIDGVLDDVRDGEIDLIVLCKKGQLGMDIPNLGFAMMPWGVKSVVPFLQIVGRVLRKYPGKQEANIYLWGPAPSIKRGLYRRMLECALKVKEDPEGPGSTLMEELEWLELNEEPDHEKIKWTKEAINSCKTLANGGLPQLSALIERKEFPRKFSRAIGRITKEMLQNSGSRGPDSSAVTPIQRRKLGELKLQDSTIASLNKGEATALINGIMRYLHRDPFIVPRGLHQGKHFSETPPMFRKHIRDPAIWKLFNDWKRAGRPTEVSS